MIRNLGAVALFGLMGAVVATADDTPGAGGKTAGRPARAQLFDRMDANKDGYLSKDEFSKAVAKFQQKMKDAGKGSKFADKMDPDAAFGKMDTNNDGMVSKDEFLAAKPFGGRGSKGKGGKKPAATTDE